MARVQKCMKHIHAQLGMVKVTLYMLSVKVAIFPKLIVSSDMLEKC